MHGHYLRLKSDAMLIGKNTVLLDNPDLHCRLDGLQSFSPNIFILDTNLEIPVSQNYLNLKREKFIFFIKKY
jgi:diaminohydroxyphosphoribosylaminopyrimidine deaminase/5-amino-6-(5-phosphoribosylamino)uracil reductase